MSRIKKNIAQQLNLATIAIDNTLNEPSIAEALAGFGYTAARLYQGRALRETALTLYQSQKGASGDAQTANDAYTAALASAYATYMRYVKVARVALEGARGMRQKLGLPGQRKEPQAAQVAQAQQFYSNALADLDILDKLTEVGITKAMLTEGHSQFNAVDQYDRARRQRQGAAGDATRVRDAALLDLANWMRDFTQVARVALRDRPQLLQMLGMQAPAARHATRLSPGTVAPVEAAVIETAAPLPTSRPLMIEDLPVQTAAAKRNGTKLAAVIE